jgi:hypothetical protein
MAIYSVNIQNEQYKKLLQDVLKYSSILIIFHTLFMLYHNDMKMLLKCDKFYENVLLFVLAIIAYHLIICEIVKIV